MNTSESAARRGRPKTRFDSRQVMVEDSRHYDFFQIDNGVAPLQLYLERAEREA
jgi:hypothetical protein